ncbi:UNVERIFIED_CONTAM: hypothetical protein GTU68_024199 [Idotea baltica]|nr:hypothetical protein [Idotea baltica]
MEYRYLGKSGLQVSALSFGSWLTFGKQIGDDVAENLMAKAYDMGVNFFDNAEIYARGESERVMGKILKKMQWDRSSYVVSSKAFFGRGDRRPNMTGLSRKHVTEACNEALQRLQVDYLDLFYCHRPDSNTPVDETVWAMNHLIQQGKILYWGTSEWSAQAITEAHLFAEKNRLIGPTMEQPQYNMLHRKQFEVDYAPLYKNWGMGTTIWSPLASGLLTGKYNDGMPSEETRLTMEGLEWLKDNTLTDEKLNSVRAISTLAKELGMSLAELALLWCVKNENVSTVITGASKIHHLEENLNALEKLPLLTDEVMEKVDELLGNKPVASPF